MNTVQRIEHWGDTHHPFWLDIVRIALGLLLLGKGISFISDTTPLTALIGGLKGFSIWSVAAVHYVAFAHLVGGFLIALGTLTRFAAGVQIPILIVAVFAVNLRRGFSYLNGELWLSLVVLALLVVFLIVGSGRFSADAWVKYNERQR